MYKEFFKEGVAEGWQKGRELGMAEGQARVISAVKAVRDYMMSHGVSIEEAMGALSIDESLRPGIKELLS